ncbi:MULTISPECIES: TetR/AcrR family transcriptional regulator [Pontibacillus]|uniref:TetR/AcrR family transcriptional regulator n=1 Tax=Pontibacillus chungwhensis TaxID=265426 RepID=A0ABY8V2S6_9BACI|nr:MULTISPECIES: TetR/AcrR family transcriptional regulator [Pontibacillus]MCD5322818.1 TetR/AcrR family transcriptional regulator [Pontibacillus sp. HN14]WIG00088.1 TetR/AcrR family transcriptional regulator [Pontibacillus chungwhensis]
MKELKDRIIDAALVLFEKDGYHGVTVNQIVEHCKASKGGFYHHFESKDELLYVIHDTFITYVLEKAHVAKQTYHYPTEQLQEMITSFVKVFDLYKPHIYVFYQESTYLKPHYEERIKEKRNEFKELLFSVIEKGQQTGDFRKELPVVITGMSILGMVNWTYKWYKKDGEKSIDEIANIYVDLILHSVLKEPDQSLLKL